IPIVLSASFALIGIQSARAHETTQQLDERIKNQEIQIQNEHYFLEALISGSNFAIVRLDTNHHVISCNQTFKDLFGYSSDEIVGRHLDDMIASEELHEEASRITAAVSDGKLERKITQRRRKDGSLVDVEIVGIPVTVGGEKIGILGLYYDLSPRREAERALIESETRFKSLFDQSPVALWEEDFSGVKKLLSQFGSQEEIIKQLEKDDDLLHQCVKIIKVLDVNQATLDLYHAKTKTELITGLADILVEESLDAFRGEIIALVKGEYTHECEILQQTTTGDIINGWLRLSLPPGYEDSWERVYISIVDITERKQTEEKMRYLSFHDVMTGLYNRAYFDEELRRLDSGRQYPISIIACDLDGLKQINDTYGHHVGDMAIKAAAKILGGGTFRKEDVIARTGGDEFIILLPSVDLDKQPVIIERLEKSIEKHNQSNLEDGLYRPISLSFGYAVIQEGESLVEGYKTADHAMYENKTKKKIGQTKT
ncbi:MAG: sensor domain-containing diguanylate cyclase, partial [Chloroflexi bacterium]|nr:sensor domain-containing diguanylate cyclase [Chloroflexota bacterium]